MPSKGTVWNHPESTKDAIKSGWKNKRSIHKADAVFFKHKYIIMLKISKADAVATVATHPVQVFKKISKHQRDQQRAAHMTGKILQHIATRKTEKYVEQKSSTSPKIQWQPRVDVTSQNQTNRHHQTNPNNPAQNRRYPARCNAAAQTQWKIMYDGWVYVKIKKGMYGLPKAGLLAQEKLKTRLPRIKAP